MIRLIYDFIQYFFHLFDTYLQGFISIIFFVANLLIMIFLLKMRVMMMGCLMLGLEIGIFGGGRIEGGWRGGRELERVRLFG